MAKIYLVCGVPGSGKTWVCEQLRDKFEYVHHDGYIHLKAPGSYLRAILDAAEWSSKPLLIEAPFSISNTKDPLEKAGHEVIPVFIEETDQVLSSRYLAREGKPIPKQHITRKRTYLDRAKTWGSFYGTSEEVLSWLKSVS